jgi:hypothetical protein
MADLQSFQDVPLRMKLANDAGCEIEAIVSNLRKTLVPNAEECDLLRGSILRLFALSRVVMSACGDEVADVTELSEIIFGHYGSHEAFWPANSRE